MSEKYILRDSNVAARMLGGEMVVLAIRDSTLFTLNEMASLIWNAADGFTPLDQIVAMIAAEFEVDPKVAYGDAVGFIDELARHGIIHVGDHPLTAEET